MESVESTFVVDVIKPVCQLNCIRNFMMAYRFLLLKSVSIRNHGDI